MLLRIVVTLFNLSSAFFGLDEGLRQRSLRPGAKKPGRPRGRPLPPGTGRM